MSRNSQRKLRVLKITAKPFFSRQKQLEGYKGWVGCQTFHHNMDTCIRWPRGRFLFGLQTTFLHSHIQVDLQARLSTGVS